MFAVRRSARSFLASQRVNTQVFRYFSAIANEYKYLTKEQKDATVWVTLNRPDLHNAFNEDVIAEITRAFKEISATVTVEAGKREVADTSLDLPRSVVLAGNGPSFSAGADLNWMAKMATYTKEQNQLDSQGLYDMFLAIHACPVPVIARVNGAALGGGSGLVAACDFAYALETAKLGFTEVGLGLIPAVISRFCLDKIGAVHAARYFVTGERFSGAEAQRIGLVSAVFPDVEQLDAAILKTLGHINNNSPAAVRAAKQLVRDVSRADMTVDRPQTRDFTAAAIAGIRVSNEGQAGLKAFLSKGKGPWVLKK